MNIHSILCTALICEKVSLAVSFSSKVNSYSLYTDVCIKKHIFFTLQRCWLCTRKQFGATSHTFANPDLCDTTEPEMQPLCHYGYRSKQVQLVLQSLISQARLDCSTTLSRSNMLTALLPWFQTPTQSHMHGHDALCEMPHLRDTQMAFKGRMQKVTVWLSESEDRGIP